MSSNHSVLEALNLRVHNVSSGLWSLKRWQSQRTRFFGQNSTDQKKFIVFCVIIIPSKSIFYVQDGFFLFFRIQEYQFRRPFFSNFNFLITSKIMTNLGQKTMVSFEQFNNRTDIRLHIPGDHDFLTKHFLPKKKLQSKTEIYMYSTFVRNY